MTRCAVLQTLSFTVGVLPPRPASAKLSDGVVSRRIEQYDAGVGAPLIQVRNLIFFFQNSGTPEHIYVYPDVKGPLLLLLHALSALQQRLYDSLPTFCTSGFLHQSEAKQETCGAIRK